MIRPYENNDYEMLVKWWKDWSWPAIPKEMLPPLGFIANEAACIFLYDTGSAIAWIEWLITDKEAEKEVRGKSIDEVISHACDVAKKAYRAKFIHTSIRNQVLEKRLLKMGFFVTDKHMVNMLKNLGA